MIHVNQMEKIAQGNEDLAQLSMLIPANLRQKARVTALTEGRTFREFVIEALERAVVISSAPPTRGQVSQG